MRRQAEVEEIGLFDCDAALGVRGEGETGWGITGFVYWFEVDGDGLTGEVPCSSLCPRPVQDLPEVASRPSCYRLARFLGSLRLLFLGDPVTPPPVDPGSISEGV